LRAFPELESKVVVSIPNGFDAADYATTPSPRRDDRFRIVHSGYFYTERQGETGRIRRLLGGMPVKGVDFMTRSHVYLLQAIDRLIQADPELADVIEVHLVGLSSAADRAVSARSPVIREHGYRSHAETLDLVRTGDLLFLPMQDLPPGTRAGLVPGKTYEYIAAGKPILAAVPDGDARELLTEVGTGLLSRPRDVDQMARLIAGAIEAWRNNVPPPRPNAEVVARYERRRQTKQLADLFDRVLGTPPSPRATAGDRSLARA
jgi:glycosyltransferase involved in cell wall biosynthesis